MYNTTPNAAENDVELRFKKKYMLIRKMCCCLSIHKLDVFSGNIEHNILSYVNTLK